MSSRARLLLACALALALTACSRNLRLNPLPAARGGQASLRVQLTYDRNNMLFLKIEGPDPSAYGPAYTRYVVWVATSGRAGAVNVGQVRVEGGKGGIQTLSPRRKFFLFVTVEEQGDAEKPGPLVLFEAPKEIDW